MSISGSGEYDLLDQLAEEFAERFRRGERPALKEYTDRYPDLADEIRDLFPAMVRVEQAEGARLGEEERTGNAQAAHPPGGQIGDYRILREIGRGGMGVVYEAEQISLGRRVALKVLPGHVSRDPMVQERFRREARAAARLHHTNIVPVYEVGQDGDVRFYAMQFIQGLGLDAVIDELRRLLDRARSQSRNEAASGGQSPQPGRAHSRQGIDTPTLGEGVEVSAVVRSILTGRFDRGVQGPESGGSLSFDSGRGPREADEERRSSGRIRLRVDVHRGPECDHRRRRRPTAGGSAGTRLVAVDLTVIELGDPARRDPALVGRVGSTGVLPQPGADRPPGRRRARLRPRRAGSCTATSSRRTCCWTPRAWSGSPTSAWPRGTMRGSPRAVTSWGRSATWRPSGSGARETLGPTSTRWG